MAQNAAAGNRDVRGCRSELQQAAASLVSDFFFSNATERSAREGQALETAGLQEGGGGGHQGW